MGAAPGPRAGLAAAGSTRSLDATRGRGRAESDGGGDRGLFDSESLRESLEEADVQFFFALAEQDSQKTIVSEFGTSSPGTPAIKVEPRSCWGEFSLTDGAVIAGWLVCLAVFLAGLWQRTVLPMREKSNADPIYYAGIALIAVGTLVIVGYFVVRVEGVRAAVRAPLSPSDAHEYVKLIPGALTMKARRETPAVRRSANMLLELGAFVLFVTPCVDIGLTANLVLADNAYLPFAVPTLVVVAGCVSSLWLLVQVFVRGSRARASVGATYLDLHLFCVYLAAVALVVAIVLGVTLGPATARKVARHYDDDEDAGDDEEVFRTQAYIRSGLFACVLAAFVLGVRLRRVAGTPRPRLGSPTPSQARAIEFRTRGSPSLGHGYGA